jgi:Matrixin
MANFSAVWKDCGFLKGSPPFLVVPKAGIGLVYLNGAHSPDAYSHLQFNRANLSVTEVKANDLQKFLLQYAANFPSKAFSEVQSLSAGMRNTMAFGSKLLSIEGRVTGQTVSLDYISKTDKAKMDVYTITRNTVNISFLFVRCKDSQGQSTGTTLVPSYAEELTGILNRLYIPSANTELKLKSSRYVDITQPLRQPIARDTFLNSIAPERDRNADLTVFFVGRYRGTDDPLGEAFSEVDCAVLDDSPSQFLAPQTGDGLVVTDQQLNEQINYLKDPLGRPKSERDLHVVLAHEIAHLLGATHITESDNLMTSANQISKSSLGRQDFKFSKETVKQINKN